MSTRRAAALVIAVQLAFWAVMTLPGYFRVDDYIYFGEILYAKPSFGDWALSIWYQHFAPGHRVAFWLMDGPTPGSWLGLELALLALLGLGLACFWGTLELLFGRSRWLLIPLAVTGFAYPLVWPLVWPSAGLQCIPSFAFGLLCVYAFVRRTAGGGAGWGALSVAALALSLSFYVRGLLLVGILALIQVLFLEPSLRPAAVARSFWRRRFVWAGLLLVSAGYVWAYRSRSAFGDYQSFTASELQQYLRIVWFRNLIPSFLGVEIGNYADLPAWKVGVQVLSQLMLVAAFVWSIRRKGLDALRAWAYVALVALATFALSAFGRLGQEGVNIGFDMRYVTDLFWQLPLGFVFALHRRRVVELGAPWPPGEPASRPSWSRFAGPAAGLATVVVVVLAMRSAEWREDWWQGSEAREWVTNARASLDEFERERGVARVVQGTVPPEIIGADFGHYAFHTWVLPQLGAPVKVEPPEGPNALIARDGRVFPVRWRARQTLDAADARTITGTAKTKDGKVCMEPVDGVPSAIELHPIKPVSGGRVVVYARAPGGVAPWARVGVNAGGAWTQPGFYRVLAGRGERAVADTGETKITGLRIYSPHDAPLCVGKIRIGVLVPG